MLKTRALALLFAASWLLGLVPGSANAAVTFVSDPQGIFFPSGNTQLKLFNYEDLGVDGGTSGVLDVGDTLRGVFQITTATQSGNIRVPLTFELTGLFDVQVASISGSGSNTQFVFEPNASFAADLASIAGGNAADYAGAMMAIFADSSFNFLSDLSSKAAAEGTATDGDLFLVLGGEGTNGSDFYWVSQGPTDLDGVTSFAASLDAIINNTGLPFGETITQVPPSGFLGSGLENILNEFGIKGSVQPNNDISNPDLAALYPFRSDDPITANVVPEPGAWLVWSLLAPCVGFVAYRRNRRK